MEITVHLPDDIAQHENAGREALQALVIEGYRKGSMSAHQGAQLLGMDRVEFQDFLGANRVEMYSVDRLRQEFEMVNAPRITETPER
jgi:predicted HTH domain antitoxin